MTHAQAGGDPGSRKVPAWVTCADLLAVALLAAALVIGRTGGLHKIIIGVHVSMTAAWRPAVLSLALIALRHLFCRRPNLLSRMYALSALTLSWCARLWAHGTPYWLARDESTLSAGHASLSLRQLMRELALVAVVMVVLTGLALPHQVARLDTVPDAGDPLFSMWRLAWTAHQLPRDPVHLFDTNMFYPEIRTLAYSDSILLPAIAASPFLWLGAPIVIVYNLFVLATFVLAGLTMYALVRTITGQAAAAVVSGVVFAFYPFRFEHYSHFELLFCFWMPLALLFLHRTIVMGRMRDGLLTGVAIACQMLSCMYFGAYLIAYLVPFWAVLAIGGRQARRGLAAIALGAVLAGAVLTPLAIPYMDARTTVGERVEGEVEFYSALPRDFLNPHWALATYAPLERRAMPERALFPGIAAVALALAALWPRVSLSRLAYGVGLLFAFEASLGLHGFVYAVLYRAVPGFHGFRVPARFSMLVGFSLAVLAGYGIARLTSSAKPRVRWIIAGLAVLAVSIETRPRLPAVPVEMKPDPIYAYFKGRPQAILAEFPTGPALRAIDTGFQYIYASTFHWQRLLNGTSGFQPPSYEEFTKETARFPDDRAMALLAARGVDYVILHEEFWGRARYLSVVIRAAERPELRLVARSQHNGFESRIYQIAR